MVVEQAEQTARKEFAGWFRAEAERIGTPEGRGAIAFLYRKLTAAAGRREKPLVTQQQLRKYYRGIDYPKPDKLRKLCEQLGFHPPPVHFTRMLEIKPPRASGDPLLTQLVAAWEAITDEAARRELVDYARWKAFGAQRGAREAGKRSGTA